MKIYAKTLIGKVVELEVESLETVAEIKEHICESEGIPTELQRLIYEGKTLFDDQTLVELNVKPESTFQLIALTDNKPRSLIDCQKRASRLSKLSVKSNGNMLNNHNDTVAQNGHMADKSESDPSNEEASKITKYFVIGAALAWLAGSYAYRSVTKK